MTVGNYFKHLLRYEDGRFAKHPRFRYFALNTEMRWRALQNGRIYIKQHPKDAYLSLSDLKEMVSSGGEQFTKRVLHYASSLRGTRQYWFQQRSRLISMIDTLGTPTVFFTHSAADTQWPELAMLFAADPESSFSRSSAINENPAIADYFFHERITKFMKYFMWISLEPQISGSVLSGSIVEAPMFMVLLGYKMHHKQSNFSPLMTTSNFWMQLSRLHRMSIVW